MKHLLPITFFTLAITTVAMAQSFSADHLPYPDVTTESKYALPISVLTEAGVLEGNPDGTFRPDAYLNRAEFMKIVLTASEIFFDAITITENNCFPDVVTADWFARYVCYAKNQNIIDGYQDGLFHPERNVNYAEVAKILVETFDLPTPSPTETWYAKYIGALEHYGIALTGINPAAFLTRGQMAQLTARFYAYAQDNLNAYLAVESSVAGNEPAPSGISSSSSSTSTISSTSSQASSPSATQSSSSQSSQLTAHSSSSSISSSPSPLPYPNLKHVPPNPLPTFDDTSQILVLGDRAREIGMFTVQPLDEPVIVKTVIVRLSSAATSIQFLEIVDEFDFKLGNAVLTSGSSNTYTLEMSLKNGYYIKKGQKILFAVRPVLNDENSNGVSGEDITMTEATVTGIGGWTSNAVYVETSDQGFFSHQTALATITKIENAENDESVLIAGTGQEIGSFRFAARGTVKSDPALTAIIFRIGANRASLSNVRMENPRTGANMQCSVSSPTITCSAIPSNLGGLREDLTLTLYGDITVSDYENAFLQISIHEQGDPNNAGDITWTDGETVFTWIPFDTPVVTGTLWK